MSKNIKRKCGFTVVELIIALTVIVVVSITALTIVLSSVSAKVNANNKTEAQNFANGVWECFKVSDSEESFLSNVSFAMNAELGEGQIDDSGYTVYTYQSEEYKFTAIIKIKYLITARSEFAVELVDKNGASIVSFTYEKGDGI